jgi:UDP-glucose 4-epimerase
LKKKKILIFGGNGFIGRSLIANLIDNNYIYSVVNKNIDLLRHNNLTIDDNFNFNEYDNFIDFDFVINLINIGTPGDNIIAIKNNISNNILPNIDILEFSSKLKIKKYILFSSGGQVYGNIPIKFIDENCTTNPITLYGINKLAIEKYANMYFEKYNLPGIIVRPSNVYGPLQNPFLNNGFISKSLHKIINNEEINIFGDGSAIRDYLYINDLVEAVKVLANSPITNQIYNISSGIGYSINEILSIYKDIFNFSFNIKYLDKRYDDYSGVILSNSKLINDTGWLNTVSLIEGITLTHNYLKNKL